MDNDTESPHSWLSDTVAHAGCGITDAGTMGYDSPSNLGIEVSEYTESGPGVLMPCPVVLNDLDPYMS